MSGLMKMTVGLFRAGFLAGKDFLTGAADLVAGSPAPSNPLDSFQGACTHSVAILRARTVSEAAELESSLASIAVTLLENMEAEQCRFIDDLLEHDVLQKMVDQVGPELPSELIEPLLIFLLQFLNTDLSQYFPRVPIHSPIAKLVSRLQILEERTPHATHEFSMEMWRACRQDRVVLDLLREKKDAEPSFPILDYFVATVWLTNARGDGFKPRKILLDLFNDTEFSEAYGAYICERLFPKLVDFFTAIAGYAQTIQFPGKMSEMIQWSDQLLAVTPPFPMAAVVERVVETFGQFQKQIALAFFLSNFTEVRVVDAVLDFCLTDNFLKEVAQSFDDGQTLRSVIALLNAMLLHARAFEWLLPPLGRGDRIDIYAMLNPAWVRGPEAAASQEEFPAKPAGRNPVVFDRLLRLLATFRELPVDLCQPVTEVILAMVRIDPDLMGSELAAAAQAVIGAFSEFDSLAGEDEAKGDSPQLRLLTFVAFCKRVRKVFLGAAMAQR